MNTTGRWRACPSSSASAPSTGFRSCKSPISSPTGNANARSGGGADGAFHSQSGRIHTHDLRRRSRDDGLRRARQRRVRPTPTSCVSIRNVSPGCLRLERCDCGEQLDAALEMIEQADTGAGYMFDEGRGIGLLNKTARIAAGRGADTVEANHALGFAADLRDYSAGAHILSTGGAPVRLMTTIRTSCSAGKLRAPVAERVPVEAVPRSANRNYLQNRAPSSPPAFPRRDNRTPTKPGAEGRVTKEEVTGGTWFPLFR